VFNRKIYIFTIDVSEMLTIQMSRLICIVGLLTVCKGVQIGFNSTCILPETILPFCNDIRKISMRAEVLDPLSPIGNRIINLVFTVPESRGEPCIYKRSINADDPYWQNSCRQDFIPPLMNHGNGIYSLRLSEAEYFRNISETWVLQC